MANVYLFPIVIFSIIVAVGKCFAPSFSSFPFVESKKVIIKPTLVSSSPSLYFPGAGIYLWWQMGAVKYMQENWHSEDIKKSVLLGASAGSVSAAFLLLNADVEKAPGKAIDLAHKHGVFSRKAGLAGVCGEIMREWLAEMIPDDANMDDVSNLHVAVTGSFGSTKTIQGFENKSDLIDALLASSHVPFFMDGKPVTNYRGEQYLDGALWYFITKNRLTGLPIPDHIDAQNIMWVDYTDDEMFMQSVSGNFLETVSPEAVYSMMEHGYNHMKREEHFGRTPFVKDRPISLRRMSTLTANAVSSLPTFQQQLLRKFPQSIDLPFFPSLRNRNQPKLA